MKRERLVKKYLPVEVYDIAGLERWLSDMAAQGLFLEKLALERAKFRRGEPCTHVRYALDVAGPCGIDRERNENYAQMGWTFVTSVAVTITSWIYYVYRSDDPGAPALHTDPVTQGGTITTLIRREIRRGLILAALMLAIAWRGLAALITSPWSIPQQLILKTDAMAVYLMLVAVWLLYISIPYVRDLRRLFQLRRRLLDGLDPPRLRPLRLPRAALGWGLTALYLVTLLAVFQLDTHARQTMTPAEEAALPHPTLAQVLAGSGERVIRLHQELELLHINTVRGSLLCPEQYDWAQRGEITREGEVATAYIGVKFYRARTEDTARRLADTLILDYQKGLRDDEKREDQFVNTYHLEVSYPALAENYGELDSLWTVQSRRAGWTEDATLCYIGRRGDQVFRLICWGMPDPERCLALLARQLD